MMIKIKKMWNNMCVVSITKKEKGACYGRIKSSYLSGNYVSGSDSGSDSYRTQ